MPKPSPKFKFGPWLPDLPELDNTGLTEANNVIWTDGTYKPYAPLSPTTVIAQGGHAISAYQASGGAAVAGTQAPGNLFIASNNASTHTYFSYAVDLTGVVSLFDCTPAAGIAFVCDRICFTQYGANLIATGGNIAGQLIAPQWTGANSGSSFQKLTGTYGDAPLAMYCGVVGQFVVLGNLAARTSGSLQWCGIDAPFDWPTPNSAQAIAEQSGAQDMDVRLGQVLAICEGDLWSVVLMEGGIVRMTYQGGDTVFEFDIIDRAPGVLGPQAWAKVGGKIYYLATTGVFVTDGVSSVPLGDGRINRWFTSNADLAHPQYFSVGVDYTSKVIYWTFPLGGNGGVPNAWLAYNYLQDRFTHGTDSIQCFVRGDEPYVNLFSIRGFNTSAAYGNLIGNPGTATLITGEVELNPGGTALVSGVRPQISGTPSNQITTSVGARDLQTQDTPVVYTTGGAIDLFSGLSDLLVDARYHRAEFQIQGAFSKAIGGEFEAQPTSQF